MRRYTKMRRANGRDCMNKAEEQFAAYLRTQDWVREWQYEAMKFCLAPRTFYTPDFLVVEEETMELSLIDVKALWGNRSFPHVEDDAMVKLKVCAQKFPYFHWKLAWFDKAQGTWQWREI